MFKHTASTTQSHNSKLKIIRKCHQQTSLPVTQILGSSYECVIQKNKKSFVWNIAGKNCTGDLRIIGVLAILMEDTTDSYLLCNQSLWDEKAWVINYLKECGVKVIINDTFFKHSYNSSTGKNTYTVKPQFKQKIPSNAQFLGREQTAEFIKKYAEYIQSRNYSNPNPKQQDSSSSECDVLSTGVYLAPNLDARAAHRLLTFQEAQGIGVPNLINKDISEYIKKFRGYLGFQDINQDNDAKYLVIWVKHKDLEAYHPEHLLSRKGIVEMIYEMIYEIMYQLYYQPNIKKLNIKIRDDDDNKSYKYKEIFNHISKTIPNYGPLTNFVSLSEYNIMKDLFPQYQEIAKLPDNTLHFGGRSGHLEVMPFLGHKVIYYEDIDNKETNRINDSLCKMRKNNKEVFMRFQGIPQTRFGYAKAIVKGSNLQNEQKNDDIIKSLKEIEKKYRVKENQVCKKEAYSKYDCPQSDAGTNIQEIIRKITTNREKNKITTAKNLAIKILSELGYNV
jgi:hypothetical protein